MSATTRAKQSGFGDGFLTFNSASPRLHITSDDPEFDPIILSHWKAEGYNVSYLPCNVDDVKAYKQELARLPEELELGESFAIVGMLLPSFS